MAQPKRKTSKSRRNNRRSHHKLKNTHIVKCKSCGANKIPHRTCPKCNKYSK